jgi:hypothetical protein
MDEQQPWTRLFGLTWMDFFTGLPVIVEMEKDLSLKKQLLDVLLIRKEGAILDCRLPDGFEDLAHYNLVTFKSHQEKLSLWTLQELVRHYVNLRKQVSESPDEDRLLRVEQFRLYAVSARYPQQLVSEMGADWRSIREGVYDAVGFGLSIRVVVPNRLPIAEHNALLHLFSTSAERLVYGGRHYHVHSPETSTLLLRLFRRIRQEIQDMSTPLEEFARETIDMLLKELPVEKRLEGVSVDELLKVLPPSTLQALLEKVKETGAGGKPE